MSKLRPVAFCPHCENITDVDSMLPLGRERYCEACYDLILEVMEVNNMIAQREVEDNFTYTQKSIWQALLAQGLTREGISKLTPEEFAKQGISALKRELQRSTEYLG